MSGRAEHLREVPGPLRMVCELEGLSLKPIKEAGEVIDTRIRFVLTTENDGEVLRALASRMGKDVTISIFPAEQLEIFPRGETEPGEEGA